MNSNSAPSRPRSHPSAQPKGREKISDPHRELAILGIDHGDRRIGLAIKHAGQNLVLPLAVLAQRTPAVACEAIRRIIRDEGISLVIVGLPVNADPAQSRIVKRFTRRLREGIAGVRWRFVDEEASSLEAAEQDRSAGIARRQDRVDDRAAALILERFLRGES